MRSKRKDFTQTALDVVRRATGAAVPANKEPVPRASPKPVRNRQQQGLGKAAKTAAR